MTLVTLFNLFKKSENEFHAISPYVHYLREIKVDGAKNKSTEPNHHCACLFNKFHNAVKFNRANNS